MIDHTTCPQCKVDWILTGLGSYSESNYCCTAKCGLNLRIWPKHGQEQEDFLIYKSFGSLEIWWDLDETKGTISEITGPDGAGLIQQFKFHLPFDLTSEQLKVYIAFS